MTGSLQIGCLVEVRGEKWQLTRAQYFDACQVFTFEGRDRDNAMRCAQFIAPFDRLRPVSASSLERRRRHAVLAHALAVIHASRSAGGLWTAAAARIDLHAYQLEPALAAIAGTTRLLLADAVGLGKTIQAGLLLSELFQRGWVERALIVCPAGLRDTWRSELRERFGLTASIIDQRSIADRVASFPPGVNPWIVDRVAIVSIDFVKREEVMAALDGAPVDLLIADEAHHLLPGTDRGAAVARLAARAAWCVLVTATPHSGDRDAFEALINLGRHGDDIAVFRRTRADVGLAQERRTRHLRMHRDPAEAALLDAIAKYSRRIWTARGRIDHAARLVAITIARRACSSRLAVEHTLRRRLALLTAIPVDAAQPRLPWEDVDESDGEEADGIIAAQGLDDLDEERQALRRLIALASASPSSAKIRCLMRLLSRVNEAAIVFTEYRDTLEAIVGALSERHRVTSIHGAMPRDARTRAVDQFNGGGCDVLVATDAAGEGLNLHHRCRLVIDFELPWNPLRLEQRIGRVDRLGQRRVVHAIRLLHGESIEQDVLERLALRRERAANDLARAVAEQDMAAAVLGGEAIVETRLPRLRLASVDAAAAEIARLSSQRRLAAHDATPGRCWSLPTRGATRRVTALLRQTLVNAHGVVFGFESHAVRVVLGRRPRCLREWRAAIDTIATSFMPSRSTPETAGRHAILRRAAAIRKLLARDQRREYQRSLFDGRADTVRSVHERNAARLEAALARIARAVAPPDPARSHIEVVAAWPERRR